MISDAVPSNPSRSAYAARRRGPYMPTAVNLVQIGQRAEFRGPGRKIGLQPRPKSPVHGIDALEGESSLGAAGSIRFKKRSEVIEIIVPKHPLGTGPVAATCPRSCCHGLQRVRNRCISPGRQGAWGRVVTASLIGDVGRW